MTSVGVFAAVFDESGRVLCVRHNYGAREWGMPGGCVDPGEDPTMAVKREILEESGVVATIAQLHGVYSAPYKDDLVLLFVGAVAERGPWTPNGEIDAIGFHPLDALPEPMAPNPRLRFRHVAEGIRGLCVLSAPGVEAGVRT